MQLLSAEEATSFDLHGAAVHQHNLKVLAETHSTLSLGRLAELVGLDPRSAEELVATMISEGKLVGKIDQVSGVVGFGVDSSSSLSLSESLAAVLSKIETVNHLINKEKR